MPLNQLKRYPDLLDITGLNILERKKSLRAVFDRDITNNTNFSFRGKLIRPIFKEGVIPLDILFHHLTTVITDKATRKRDFDMDRSKRLHWIKYHIEEKKQNNILLFSAKDKNGKRTYIFDEDEMYVIILEPKINANKEQYYYLLTAYYLRGGDKKKIKNKYKRRLQELL